MEILVVLLLCSNSITFIALIMNVLKNKPDHDNDEAIEEQELPTVSRAERACVDCLTLTRKFQDTAFMVRGDGEYCVFVRVSHLGRVLHTAMSKKFTHHGVDVKYEEVYKSPWFMLTFTNSDNEEE